jgi:REP element-mobilizing transposase RayT
VTTNALPGKPNLRGRKELDAFEACLRKAAERDDFRIVHFTVQRNHLHLLVEAQDKGALSSAMNGLISGLARRLNKIWQTSGPVFAGRYHACPKETPRQVQRALAYLFRNGVKHGVVRKGHFDPASSVQAFLGATREALSRIDLGWLAAPVTWLLRTGWRRAGTIPRRDLITAPA